MDGAVDFVGAGGAIDIVGAGAGFGGGVGVADFGGGVGDTGGQPVSNILITFLLLFCIYLDVVDHRSGNSS